jgi:hypothetical protein
VAAEQLVGQEHDDAGAGDGDAGDRAARQRLVAVAVQDEQREDRPAGEDERTRERRRPVDSVRHHADVEQVADEAEAQQREGIGARDARPARAEANAEQERRRRPA